MIPFLLKKKRFLAGFSFLLILFAMSMLNTFINGGKVGQVQFLMDEKGNMLAAPPYPPLSVFLLGSDYYGNDLLHMIIEGAKYTIGIAFLTAGLRLILSLMISYGLSSLRPRLYKGVCSLFEPFSVIPQTLICTFILAGILFMPRDGFTTPLWARMAFELFILTVIALPTLSVHLSDEIRRAEQETFIEASKTIGGRKFHIFFHHLVPLLRERWIIAFGRQFLQVLLLLAHLGVFRLFFGGTLLQESTSSKPPLSATQEWSGLIGGSLSNLYVSQWIALVPLVFFALTAIAAALVNDAVKEYFSSSHENRKTTAALPDAKAAELKKAL